MSRWPFVSALNTRRRSGDVRRDLLEMDAGALLVPTAYPYASGTRPVRPFAARVLNPGQGPRPRMQLFPPDGNPTQRNFAHVDYIGRAAARHAPTRDAAGVRQGAKITRTRPWLFAGGSSATMADKLAGSIAASSPATPAGECEGCG